MSIKALAGLTLAIAILLPACTHRPAEEAFFPSSDTVAQTNAASETANDSQTELNRWVGSYTFEEFSTSDQTSSDQTTTYQIRVRQVGNTYSANLNIDGSPTSEEIEGYVEVTGENKVGVFFNQYRKENVYSTYQPGDLLLELEELSGDRLKVTWGVLSPLLLEHQSEFVPDHVTIKR